MQPGAARLLAKPLAREARKLADIGLEAELVTAACKRGAPEALRT